MPTVDSWSNNPALRKSFSTQLIQSLEVQYGGNLPSLSTIARDFSLRARTVRHVSNETVRKWIKGDAVPQMERMQVLIEWLGEEITKPFLASYESNKNHEKQNNSFSPQNVHNVNTNSISHTGHIRQSLANYSHSPRDIQELFLHVNRLSKQEFKLISTLVKTLSQK